MRKIMLSVALSTSLFCKAEQPLLKFGVITDTHIGRTEQSCERSRAAYELFRDEKVGLVVHCGDIADQFYPEGYRHYRAMVDRIIGAGWSPEELFVYAFNHDALGAPSREHAYQIMKDYLRIPNNPYDRKVVNGYTFLIFPEDLDIVRYRKAIAEETAASPGRPLFVVSHTPAFDTIYNSCVWGSPAIREVLDEYPNVIYICGHVHGTPRNELDIWQGKFTAVNVGTLQIWDGELTGVAPVRKPVNMALIFNVYRDRIVIRRYHTLKRTEYHGENPWVVPLPFKAETAPYNPVRRAVSCPAPEFSAGAVLEASADGVPFRQVRVKFPEAEHPEGVFKYRIEGFRRNPEQQWRRVFQQEIFGNFYFENGEGKQIHEHDISGGFFEGNCEYQLRVTPVNWFEKGGRPLTAVVRLPEKAFSMVVWKSASPMIECPFLSGFTGGSPLPCVNGFFLIPRSETEDKLDPSGCARLVFPQGVWNGVGRKTRFRFTVDMQTIQEGRNRWTIVLRNPDPILHTNRRISTPPGDSGIMRYVLEFTKINTDDHYYLLLREGGAGKVKFHSVKIERLEDAD